MILVPPNVHNLQQTPSNKVPLNSYDLNILKCVQLALITLKLYPRQLK